MNVRGDGFCLLNAINAYRSEKVDIKSLESYIQVFQDVLQSQELKNIQEDMDNINNGMVINDLSEDWVALISRVIDSSIIIISSGMAVHFNPGRPVVYFLIHRSNHFYITSLQGRTTTDDIINILRNNFLYYVNDDKGSTT